MAAAEVNQRAIIGFVIYEKPIDFPSNFVVRRFAAGKGRVEFDERAMAIVNDLEAARESLPEGLVRIPRSRQDAPQIVETWI